MYQKHTKHQKKNHQKSATDIIEAAFGHIAVSAMALASFVTVLEAHEHRETKALPVLQPAFAVAGEQGPESAQESHTYQRLEEIRHPHASYGMAMRSHPTSGAR